MIKAVNFPNIGFLKIQFTKEQLTPILEEIAEIENNFISAIEANKSLAGNIDKQYFLFKSYDFINSLLKDGIIEYEDKFNFLSTCSPLSKSVKLCVKDIWVNFQSKHEFNPIHNHAGVFSFVLWIKIPYYIDKETDKSPGKKSNNPLAGHFSFVYTNTLGEICQYHIPADQTLENCMLIFPAKMHHSVHPFYSTDDYRISVSGNIVFQV
jgi:hypothetical protein